MKYLLLGAACLCGVVLIIKMATGSVDAGQVAGVGIIFAALAQVAPN